jgi:hypothetical protein
MPTRRPVAAVLLPVLLLLGACATARPIDLACRNLDAYRDAVPLTAAESRIAGADAAPAAPSRLAERIAAALARQGPAGLSRDGAPAPAPADIIVLSGGGQNGAYGAGVLAAWPQRPRFALVTGVSTGALQASDVFAGDAAGLQRLLQDYRIADERELVVRRGETNVLSRGFIADQSPLQARLAARVEDFMARIRNATAAAGDENRLLLVGVVDPADEKLYAIDLTRIAHADDPERASCFVGALLASSAEPIIFRPVRVGGHILYDAGVRRAVFVARLNELVTTAGGGGTLYMLFNGRLGTGREVPRPDMRHDTLATLRRTVSILVDQVQIDSLLAATVAAPTFAPRYTTTDGSSCVKADSDALFDPAYMACLADYGVARADDADLWRPFPAP